VPRTSRPAYPPLVTKRKWFCNTAIWSQTLALKVLPQNWFNPEPQKWTFSDKIVIENHFLTDRFEGESLKHKTQVGILKKHLKNFFWSTFWMSYLIDKVKRVFFCKCKTLVSDLVVGIPCREGGHHIYSQFFVSKEPQLQKWSYECRKKFLNILPGLVWVTFNRFFKRSIGHW
jgi:hypothetical protein